METLPQMLHYEFCRPAGIHYFAHLRLCDSEANEPGMIGMLLARSEEQPDFNETDGFILARLLPILEAVVRRSLQSEEQIQAIPILETMVDRYTPPILALDLNGRLLKANEDAEKLLMLRQNSKTVPEPLVQGAIRLRKLIDGCSPRPQKNDFWCFLPARYRQN